MPKDIEPLDKGPGNPSPWWDKSRSGPQMPLPAESGDIHFDLEMLGKEAAARGCLPA